MVEEFTFKQWQVQIQRRAYHRKLSLTLKVSGQLRLVVPARASRSDILSFLGSNEEWIKQNLNKFSKLRARHPRKNFNEGEEFLLLGQRLRLQLRRSQDEEVEIDTQGKRLLLGFAQTPTSEQIQKKLRDYYECVGRTILKRRVEILSAKMQLQPSRLRFAAQRTRWGSCSARGVVSLNWKLAIAPMPVIDYVVIHELAHLRHHNHSLAFWQLVAQHTTYLEDSRDWLRANQYEADFLSTRSELHTQQDEP